MGTVVILALLLVMVGVSLRGSLKHFKGEGGCCQGGGTRKAEKKNLEGEKIGERMIHIEGMHCDNCKNSVERQLNAIEGVACKVNLKKKIAVVSFDREIAEEDLIRAVERADFTVSSIE